MVSPERKLSSHSLSPESNWTEEPITNEEKLSQQLFKMQIQNHRL